MFVLLLRQAAPPGGCNSVVQIEAASWCAKAREMLHISSLFLAIFNEFQAQIQQTERVK